MTRSRDSAPAGSSTVGFGRAGARSLRRIVIRMSAEAGGPHHTPHFHAYRQGQVAAAGIDLVIAGAPRCRLPNATPQVA